MIPYKTQSRVQILANTSKTQMEDFTNPTYFMHLIKTKNPIDSSWKGEAHSNKSNKQKLGRWLGKLSVTFRAEPKDILLPVMRVCNKMILPAGVKGHASLVWQEHHFRLGARRGECTRFLTYVSPVYQNAIRDRTIHFIYGWERANCSKLAGTNSINSGNLVWTMWSLVSLPSCCEDIPNCLHCLMFLLLLVLRARIRANVLCLWCLFLV